MIPITDHTITAVAALIYNAAYNQDPDTGWLADDPTSASGNKEAWLEWTKRLLEVMQEQPQASDEQILEQAAKRVDIKEAGTFWDTIWMQQTEDGDEYSTITKETDIQMPLVRDFLEYPSRYVEGAFLENDPVYLAWLEQPI